MALPQSETPTDPPADALDVTALRAHFPSLESGIAHFDGPGGTQTPREVGQAIADVLTGSLSNRGELVSSERRAAQVVTAFREAYSDLLAMPPETIVHGRSATQLTYDFSRHLAREWEPGDEIVLSRLEHDANVRPWLQVAERSGVGVRWIDFDPATGELDLDTLDAALSARTRLVAVTGASNLIGTKPALRTISDRAHGVGALVWVDAVHLVPHAVSDVPATGADFLVCSPYKFFGPHLGVLTGRAELLARLRPDKLLPSSDAVPERFELGTLPYEVLAGATAAVDFLAGILPGEGLSRRARLVASLDRIDAHELALRERLERGLGALDPRVVLHSRAAERTPTVLLTLTGLGCAEAYAHLAAQDVLAPAGSFYAVEPFRRLALDEPRPLRLGLAPYSTTDDVDRLLAGLGDFMATR